MDPNFLTASGHAVAQASTGLPPARPPSAAAGPSVAPRRQQRGDRSGTHAPTPQQSAARWRQPHPASACHAARPARPSTRQFREAGATQSTGCARRQTPLLLGASPPRKAPWIPPNRRRAADGMPARDPHARGQAGDAPRRRTPANANGRGDGPGRLRLAWSSPGAGWQCLRTRRRTSPRTHAAPARSSTACRWPPRPGSRWRRTPPAPGWC